MIPAELLRACIEAKIWQVYYQSDWKEILRLLETEGQEAAEQAIVTTFFFGVDELERLRITPEQREQQQPVIYRAGGREYVEGRYYELYCRSCRTQQPFYATSGTLECNRCKSIRVETLINATNTSVMSAERYQWGQQGEAYLHLIKYLKPNPVFCAYLFALYQQEQAMPDEQLMRELQCNAQGYSYLCFERFPQVARSIELMRHTVKFDVARMKTIFTQMQQSRIARLTGKSSCTNGEILT